MTIICSNHIEIRNSVLIGWDTLIMDNDFHYVKYRGQNRIPPCIGSVLIGEHVWIGCRVTILKNSSIPNGSVVASSSVITKQFTEPYILLAGNPAFVKKHNIEWLHDIV